MNRFIFLIRLSACIFALICIPSVGDASSQPSYNRNLCEIIDFEDMRRRFPVSKRALNLNVGEPRTVRMIYFLPNDRPFQQAVVDSMKVTIRQVQTFFAEQMEAHGYGRKTFRFETDVEGEPVVHRVDGAYPNSYYIGGNGFWDDIPQKFNFQANNVYLEVWDNGEYILSPGVGGSGGGGRDGGSATVPSKFRWTTVAHELGHAFGLGHDWRDRNYIMSYGHDHTPQLSACAAEFLSVHPYFDSDIPDEATPPPTIELISPNEYPTGSTSISIQLKVSDPDGLHQVLLFATGGLKACRSLNGETNAVVQFDYDGVIPSSVDPQGTGTSLSNPTVHRIFVEAVDSFGNVGDTILIFFDISTQDNLIATLEGHTNRVYDVAFSPDGSILVSASRNHTIKLWEVATKREIATFIGGDKISFSPDGLMLASASGSTIKLWDVATRETIATLEGHTSWVNDVTFSPDGSTLASAGGFRDHTVKLWDVATRETIATLEGHTDQVVLVSFSPDGSILASASEDATVKLWDVMTRETIATLRGERWSGSVSFSPDGSILAYASGSTIKLWDVASRREIATFEGYSREMTFSPDGSILASASDSFVQLWDVAMRTKIATFGGHTSFVHSVSFSPDGSTLASGSWDGTVKLWDASAIIPRLQPQTLVKVSGDKQKGTPGAVLETPMVVEVKDQNGNVLEGVAVTFAVTEGDGTLSVKTATTNSRGRAQTRLTLGNSLKTTIVAVTVTGIDEHVIFTSKVLRPQPQTLVKVSGDNQEGVPSALLADPLVVEVKDQNGNALEGVVVTFAVTNGSGTLSVLTDTTDANGRAHTILALGNSLKTTIVAVTVAGIDEHVIFVSEAMTTPDFDGDSMVGFPDFLQFVEQFGFSQRDEGYQARFDLDGDGVIGFGDFLLFANNFGGQISSHGGIKLENHSIYTISAGVLVVHKPSRFSMNYLTRMAPAEYESLAEVGEPSTLIASLKTNPNVYRVIKTNVLEPNSEAVITVSGIWEEDAVISYMGMILQTNDGVVWLNSMPLYNKKQYWAEIIDMGTEQNSPIGSGFSGGQPDPTQGDNNIDNGVATNEPVVHHPQFYDDPFVSFRVVLISVNP